MNSNLIRKETQIYWYRTDPDNNYNLDRLSSLLSSSTSDPTMRWRIFGTLILACQVHAQDVLDLGSLDSYRIGEVGHS